MRTVLRIFKIQRGRIILFSKGCPSPLLAPSAPSPPLPLHRRQGKRLPFAAGAATPASGRVGRRRQPLAGAALLVAAAHRSSKRRPCGLLPLRAIVAPCGLALAAAWSWVASPTWGLAAPPPCYLRCENATRTRRSYIPVFQIRMEKMKEVKYPPL
ncbi:hypothetical protein GW17_00061451 [Ensete ventricosum]|nr:hypothetical protein GW17_00061451 [Ensete ventricosum]